MTGPEHYREAERLMVNDAGSHARRACASTSASTTVRAQVHATLALIAATVDMVRHGNQRLGGR